MTDILSRIDDALTYHSAGLGVDLEVPVERVDDEEVDLVLIPLEAGTVYRVAATITYGATMESIATVIRPALTEAFKRLAEGLRQLKPAFAAIRQVEAERRTRLRRMHHLYRMRRRKW